MGVDARLAPTAVDISIGKSSKSSHITLLSTKSITSVFIAGFYGYPVDINILVAVEKVINKIPYFHVITEQFYLSDLQIFIVYVLKGISFKCSGNYIVAPNFCFLR